MPKPRANHRPFRSTTPANGRRVRRRSLIRIGNRASTARSSVQKPRRVSRIHLSTHLVPSAATDPVANAVAIPSAADIAARTVANGEAEAADVCKCLAPARVLDGCRGPDTIAAAGSIALIAAFELVLRRTSPSPEVTQDAPRAKM